MPARGPPDFGWDPVFEFEGRTYAEMDKDEKVSETVICLTEEEGADFVEFDQPSVYSADEAEGVAGGWGGGALRL